MQKCNGTSHILLSYFEAGEDGISIWTLLIF